MIREAILECPAAKDGPPPQAIATIDGLPKLDMESDASQTMGFLRAVTMAVRRHGPRLRLIQADGSEKILLGEARFGHAWRLHSRSLIKEVDHESAPASLARLILDNNLTTAREGPEWEAMRQKVAPLMRYKMRSYAGAVEEASHELIAGLADNCPDAQSLWSLCARWAAHSVCLPVLGIGFTDELVLDLVNGLRECMFHLVRQSIDQSRAALLRDEKLLRLRAQMAQIVADSVRLSRLGDETMVATLLAQAGYVNGEPSAELLQELQPILTGALAASVHNNSLAMYWTLMRLAQCPDVADGIADEHLHTPADAETHLINTPWTLASVREALRLSPVLPFIERKAAQDMTLCDLFIPKGTVVVFSPWVVHRDEANWPDPLRFDPHRFADADRLDMTRWFPFGLGHRACIGSNLALNQLVRGVSLVCSHLNLSMPETNVAAHWRPTLRVLLEPAEDGGRLCVGRRIPVCETSIQPLPEKHHEAVFC